MAARDPAGRSRMAAAPFKQYRSPESSQEVVELLTRYGEAAVLLAGGTFLHGLAARGLMSKMEALISLQKAGLDYVKPQGGSLTIGAMATFRELLDASPVKGRPELGAIADALEYPPPQILNAATVGGSTASAYPLFDLPVALIALGGAVVAQGPGGRREIKLEQFFLDYFRHALGKGEFLAEVIVPKLPDRSASAFLKLETNANDLALLNVGVRVTIDEEGLCRGAVVAFGGGIGGVPVRAATCETYLEGSRLSAKLLDESAQAVTHDVHPISDHRASARYRATAAKVLARRALIRALARLGLEFG